MQNTILSTPVLACLFECLIELALVFTTLLISINFFYQDLFILDPKFTEKN